MSSFPHYQQLDAMDCGPTCLRIVARFYGKSYSLHTLRDRCHITREGVSLLGISDAAESIGFRTAGVRLTWEQLRDQLSLPCIVHWHQRHFIVVYDIRKQKKGYKISVSDPASGLLVYDEKPFLNGWLQSSGDEKDVTEKNGVTPAKTHGIALILEPTPAFYKEKGEDDRKMNFRYLAGYLRPYKSYIVQILLAMFVASGISLIMPFITQSVVDTGIGTGNISFIVMLLVAELVLVIGQMCNNLIRSWLMLHMTTRVSISLISDFLCKLMRLPIAFFDSKMIGDIMQRISQRSMQEK